MNIRRTAAATMAAAALVLAPTATGVADAAPGKGSSSQSKSQVKSQVKQVLKDISVKDRALVRVTGSRSLTRLADENEVVLVESIEADRAELADLKAEAAAADSTYDAKAVRTEVRGFRVEIYTQAVGIVRNAEKLAVEAAEDAEALELVDLALESALALNSHSAKADVQVAKDYLEQAEAELADVDEPVDPVDPVEPVEPTV